MTTEPLITSHALDDWCMWMPEQLLNKRDNKSIPLKEFTQALDNAAEQADKPHLGWLVGSSYNYHSLGSLGQAVLGAKTLGMGLHLLCRYYPVLQDATHVKLEVHNNIAKLSYKIIDPSVICRQQDALYTLSIFSNFIRGAVQSIWPHVNVHLEAAKTEKTADLFRYVQAPVFYGNSANEIVFPAKFLNSPMAQNEDLIPQDISSLNETLSLKNRNMLTSDRVRYIIYECLFDSNVSQEFVAEELGCSTRTLRRKLSSEGISYQNLLDDCRMEVAAREIAISEQVSFSQLALKLGYSEHSTFTRAFLRWSGVTPRTFRLNNKTTTLDAERAA